MIKKLTVLAVAAVVGTIVVVGLNKKPDYTNQEVLNQNLEQTSINNLFTNQSEPNRGLKPKKVIKPLEVNNERTLNLSFPIQDGPNFDDFKNKLSEMSKTDEPIFLLIDSPGGSVVLGNQILSLMEASEGPVYTVCISFCASMAAIILEHGTKRFALDRTVIMFHDAAGGMQGSLEQMNGLLQFYRRMIEKTNRHIAERSGMSLEKFLSLEAHELWIDSEDAKNMNLLDDLVKLK